MKNSTLFLILLAAGICYGQIELVIENPYQYEDYSPGCLLPNYYYISPKINMIPPSNPDSREIIISSFVIERENFTYESIYISDELKATETFINNLRIYNYGNTAETECKHIR